MTQFTMYASGRQPATQSSPQEIGMSATQKRSYSAMQKRSYALAAAIAACALTLGLAGCSATTASNAPLTQATSLSGRAHGGNFPIQNATVQLYAAGSGGYGSPATPLLDTAITTDSNGIFTITGHYTCPTPSTQVYLTTMGGNPGLTDGTNNAGAGLMSALGPCSGLSSIPFVWMNEVTTVASVWALSHFMQGYAAVGSTSTNAAGLAQAFNAYNKLITVGTAAMPGPLLASGATLPIEKINTIADALATCINSTGGVAGDPSPCGALYTAATPPGGPAPTDTIGAAMNIARNPSLNVAAVFALVTGDPVFGPTLSAVPSDWTLAINYTGGGLNAPKGTAVDAAGNIWVANSGAGANSLSEFNNAGTAISGSAGFTGGGLNVPTALAVDPTGNVWVANAGSGTSVLSKFTSAGTPVSATGYTGGGLNIPKSISVDGNGNVWLANSGANTVSEFSNSGVALSGSGYSGGGVTTPIGIAINPR